MLYKQSGQDVLVKSRPNVSVLDFDRKILLDRIQHELENRNVKAAYIFGSFARGNANLWSDIDLLIVNDSPLPFIERPREFFDLLDIGISFDILVYTPDEFAHIKSEKNGFWKEIQSVIMQIV